ncbi:hypothetical protein DB346_02815 [Verrucomicrobia bacterium LW23]|nr:hypothetical protein DB346_03840 [Verrucomicrobia bacterium LW23]PTY04380.1 hypothetical protein DB346_02815 [Verrucomicrobia bacterium LW23]
MALKRQKSEWEQMQDRAWWNVFVCFALAGPVLPIVLVTLLVGCAMIRPPEAAVTSQNVRRLQARPDAPAAVRAAPEWARDALQTISALEAELREERIRETR